jgi:hypothetical protein
MSGLIVFWLAWHFNLLLWIVAGALQPALFAEASQARLAAALESLRAGWLLATLVGLAWWSGMTFLVGGTLSGRVAGEVLSPFAGEPQLGPAMAALRIASLLLAACAAAWAARRWPGLRTPASAGVAVVLVALAGFMPTLGAALLALSLCAVEKRWRLAATAALASAWILGAFYYALAWPLATKGLVLLLAGIVLGALGVARVSRSGAPDAAAKPVAESTLLRWGPAAHAR